MHTLSVSGTHVTVTKANSALPCYHAPLNAANLATAQHHLRLLAGHPTAMDQAVLALHHAEDEHGCSKAKAALIELGY